MMRPINITFKTKETKDIILNGFSHIIIIDTSAIILLLSHIIIVAYSKRNLIREIYRYLKIIGLLILEQLRIIRPNMEGALFLIYFI